jgi:hypothetical protein
VVECLPSKYKAMSSNPSTSPSVLGHLPMLPTSDLWHVQLPCPPLQSSLHVDLMICGLSHSSSDPTCLCLGESLSAARLCRGGLSRVHPGQGKQRSSHLPGSTASGRPPHNQILEGWLWGWSPGQVDTGGGDLRQHQVERRGVGVDGRSSCC